MRAGVSNLRFQRAQELNELGGRAVAIPPQSSVASIWPNPRGISTCSISIGSSRFAARVASSLTQSDSIEIRDHSTMTHLASARASPMTSLKLKPGGMFRSHHIVNPFLSSFPAKSSAVGRSPQNS